MVCWCQSEATTISSPQSPGDFSKQNIHTNIIMSGFPYDGLAQQLGLFPSYYTTDENGQPRIQTSNFIHNGPMPHLPPYVSESLSTGIRFQDPTHPLASAQGGSRNRRRVAASGEHVKFRRTRSGCYTCRNRRVKVCNQYGNVARSIILTPRKVR